MTEEEQKKFERQYEDEVGVLYRKKQMGLLTPVEYSRVKNVLKERYKDELAQLKPMNKGVG